MDLAAALQHHFGFPGFRPGQEEACTAALQDRDVLEENFREYDFPTRPYPAKEYFDLPLQEVDKKDPKVLKENPDRYTDMSLVKEIEASGFIDKLFQEYKVK